MVKKKILSDEPTKKYNIVIPPLDQHQIRLRLKGVSPLIVNNKMAVVQELDDIYSGGKTKHVKGSHVVDKDVLYVRAFYTLPDSKYPAPHPKGLYGIPTSGIKKCACAAIRHTGINDNTSVGLIQKAFFIVSDTGWLTRIYYKKLERDIRPVNVGSGQKTVPQLRHRPMFHGWYLDLTINYNPTILSPDQLVNLFMHAGAYIGLCEMRAQKNQGECGGFVVETIK